ncbi:MAG: hypothetical protein ACPHK0_08540 [Dehalococcoidia bacterium]
MVPTSYSPQIRIHFDIEFFREIQKVTVSVRGFDYPGEVIVSPRWDADFGVPLSGTSMFRLVLLTSESRGIDLSSLAPGIAVVVPVIKVRGIREVAEVSYELHSDRIDSQLATLRETRSEYSASGIHFDSALLSAISKSESRLNKSMAETNLEGWRAGNILTAENKVRADRMFATNEQAAWLEYVASKLCPPRTFGPPETFLHALRKIKEGKVDGALPELSKASGVLPGDPTPLASLNELLERAKKSGSAEDVRMLLLRNFSFPPLVANIWLAAWICTQNLEVRLSS